MNVIDDIKAYKMYWLERGIDKQEIVLNEQQKAELIEECEQVAYATTTKAPTEVCGMKIIDAI